MKKKRSSEPPKYILLIIGLTIIGILIAWFLIYSELKQKTICLENMRNIRCTNLVGQEIGITHVFSPTLNTSQIHATSTAIKHSIEETQQLCKQFSNLTQNGDTYKVRVTHPTSLRQGAGYEYKEFQQIAVEEEFPVYVENENILVHSTSSDYVFTWHLIKTTDNSCFWINTTYIEVISS